MVSTHIHCSPENDPKMMPTQATLDVAYMTFFFQPNAIGVIFKKIRSLPSFKMEANSFCSLKNASIHHKNNPYGSRGLMNDF